MKIEGTGNVSMGMPRQMGRDMDATGRSIQDQIQKKQEEMKKLSENKDMSPDEKMKKRQELQQEISDLNMQLRQHELEQRRDQQDKGNAMDEMLGGSARAASKAKTGQNAGLSQASMKAMISADSSMKIAEVQGSVATQMEDRANVLKSEISLDGSRGGDTKAKEEELANAEQKAADAAAGQISSLSAANKEMEQAVETDREDGKAEKDKKKEEDTIAEKSKEGYDKTKDAKAKNDSVENDEASGVIEDSDRLGDAVTETASKPEDKQNTAAISSDGAPSVLPPQYASVDIRV